MDKKYWKNYYEMQNVPLQASLFAQFVLENYVKEGNSMIEFGCGNGRDSFLFGDHGVDVLAIDQCENEISVLKEKNNISNIRFICDDFTKLGEAGLFDNVYSRFTLHSITEKEESDVIKWAYEHMKNDGRILIETRGKKNELYKLGNPVQGESDAYIYDGHFRRFIDINKLYEKLTDIGFDVVLAKEDPGFAPFGETDYHFIRMIAVKK